MGSAWAESTQAQQPQSVGVYFFLALCCVAVVLAVVCCCCFSTMLLCFGIKKNVILYHSKLIIMDCYKNADQLYKSVNFDLRNSKQQRVFDHPLTWRFIDQRRCPAFHLGVSSVRNCPELGHSQDRCLQAFNPTLIEESQKARRFNKARRCQRLHIAKEAEPRRLSQAPK